MIRDYCLLLSPRVITAAIYSNVVTTIHLSKRKICLVLTKTVVIKSTYIKCNLKVVASFAEILWSNENAEKWQWLCLLFMVTMILHEKIFTGIVILYIKYSNLQILSPPSSTYRKHVRALSRPDQHYNEIEFSDNRGQNNWNRSFFTIFSSTTPLNNFEKGLRRLVFTPGIRYLETFSASNDKKIWWKYYFKLFTQIKQRKSSFLYVKVDIQSKNWYETKSQTVLSTLICFVISFFW